MMFERLIAWWTRPSLRRRVLDVLVEADEPLLGRDIAKRAEAGFVGPYTLLRRLEAEGLIESREAPELAVVSGRRVYHRRVYWLRGKERGWAK